MKGVIAIGFINKLRNWLAPTKTPNVSEWYELTEDYEQTHLKQSALDTVVGRIQALARLVSFESPNDMLNYRLNVKSNDNYNAMDFRNRLIEQLLVEGEVLIIQENNQLYIADDFTVDDAVLRNKKYENVVIDGLAMNKHYYADEVCHVVYTNDRLKAYLEQLDRSYGRLFSRMVDIHMREQQIRVYANFKSITSATPEMQQHFYDYLRNTKKSLEEDSIAVVPVQDDYELSEESQSYLGRSVTEVGEVEKFYIRQVANVLQAPPVLFTSELADVSVHIKSFIRDCIRPIMELVANEFTAKYFTKSEIAEGKKVTVNTVKVLYNSELEMANNVEKMIGSGVWTIDDVRELQGKDRLNTKVTTQRYLTRNIAPINEDGTVGE